MLYRLFTLSDGYLIGMLLWLLLGCVAFPLLLKLRQRFRDQPKRRRLVHFGLSVWMLLAGVTLIELYFALIFDGTDAFNQSNVSRVWFRRHVEPELRVLEFADGTGIQYRDDHPFPESVPANQHHICFIGDSFTYGHGVADVSDRFSNRIRAKLAEAAEGEFVVSNLADAGKDLAWVNAVVEQLNTSEMRIDTLVYVVCLNDIEAYHPNHMLLYNKLAELEPRNPLLAETFFLNLLYYRLSILTVPEARGYYDFLADYYGGAPWERMKRDFDRLRELCEQGGIDLRVAIFPMLHDLEEDSPFALARGRIAGYCAEHNVPAIDLTPALAEHRDERLVVSALDAHPNPRAHQIAAEEIYRELLGDLLEAE